MISRNRLLILLPIVTLILMLATLVRPSSRFAGSSLLSAAGRAHPRQFAPGAPVLSASSPSPVAAAQVAQDPKRPFFSGNKLTQLDLSGMSAKDAVNTAISADSVVVFSKSYCPYCKAAKALLEELNAGAKVYELDLMDEGADWQAYLGDKSGQSTVPSVWINGEFVGGNSDVQSLHKKGDLRKKLGAKA